MPRKNMRDTEGSPTLSRRQALMVAGASAVAAVLPSVAAASPQVRAMPRRRVIRPETPAQSMTRRDHTATSLFDGRILVVGGRMANSTSVAQPPLASAQIYDPRGNTWVDVAPLKTPRSSHAAVLLPDGRVIVIGGEFGGPISSTEIYDPRTNSWTTGPSLLVPRHSHSAATYGSSVIVFGGTTATPTASTEILNPSFGLRPITL